MSLDYYIANNMHINNKVFTRVTPGYWLIEAVLIKGTARDKAVKGLRF